MYFVFIIRKVDKKLESKLSISDDFYSNVVTWRFEDLTRLNYAVVIVKDSKVIKKNKQAKELLKKEN